MKYYWLSIRQDFELVYIRICTVFHGKPFAFSTTILKYPQNETFKMKPCPKSKYLAIVLFLYYKTINLTEDGVLQLLSCVQFCLLHLVFHKPDVQMFSLYNACYFLYNVRFGHF